jgi:hypothetical protein
MKVLVRSSASRSPGSSVTAISEERLVAIDVLLEPDDRINEAAEEWNKRLREQLPDRARPAFESRYPSMRSYRFWIKC